MLDFIRFRVWDILDILLVSALIFYFLTFLRGTQAGRMVYALIFIFLLSFVVRSLDLRALGIILDSLKAVWVVVFVIIFQPEIRNALGRFGRLKFLRFFLKEEIKEDIVNDLLKAIEEIKERRFGALIVLEREIGLREFVETGVRLETKFSPPLLVTIFTPNSPLHDGACIISGDTILAAGCTLPLSEAPFGFGMRHRAGLGITEISDALAVIVSEERGTVSLAYKGKIHYDLDRIEISAQLRKILKG
uniref:Diadenylate cyclase n=1 Tax=candidate division WOR-3 bacterium TaxID=2052148 RepID=A0A7C3YSZ0_UNCW3